MQILYNVKKSVSNQPVNVVQWNILCSLSKRKEHSGTGNRAEVLAVNFDEHSTGGKGQYKIPKNIFSTS